MHFQKIRMINELVKFSCIIPGIQQGFFRFIAISGISATALQNSLKITIFYLYAPRWICVTVHQYSNK